MVAGLFHALGLLPLAWALPLGRAVGRAVWRVAWRPRGLALAHLELAFPELDPQARAALGAQSFEALGEHLFELICAHQLRGQLRGWVDFDAQSRAALDAALAEGRGVLVLTGHIGSWELAAQAVAAWGYEVLAVARRIHEARLEALIEGSRSAGGVETLHKGSPMTGLTLLRRLRRGGAVFMLVDQDTDVPSHFAPFFGRPAATPRAPADLALRQGVALIMGFIHRRPGGGHTLRCERLALPPPSGAHETDALAISAAINQRIEAELRQHPAQWVWFHRRWRRQPAPERAS